jgi:hypothetical protein
MRSSKEILNLTLYESRINRNLKKNMEELRRLQAERKAQKEKALEEAFLVERKSQLKRSRALVKSAGQGPIPIGPTENAA